MGLLYKNTNKIITIWARFIRAFFVTKFENIIVKFCKIKYTLLVHNYGEFENYELSVKFLFRARKTTVLSCCLSRNSPQKRVFKHALITIMSESEINRRMRNGKDGKVFQAQRT